LLVTGLAQPALASRADPPATGIAGLRATHTPFTTSASTSEGGLMVEAPFTGANVRVSSIGRADYGAVRPAS
jgi:hypothetical protein